MIPLQFGLFYSGAPMSYLRYLCFKTLRHFHPNSKIQLYTTEKYEINAHNWNREKQDFESPSLTKDYMKDLKDLDVEIIMLKGFAEKYDPVVQSDIWRWWWLKNGGGIYLDTDQIILKSFETLPLQQYDLLYSLYPNPQCGMYAPVGVICANKDSLAIDYVMKHIIEYHQANNYNSTGPFMWIDVIKKVDMSNTFNVPSICWYPALHSDMVSEIYNGNFEIPSVSVALHLYLGHPLSQDFNKIYTEEFAKDSNDTISKKIRELGLL